MGNFMNINNQPIIINDTEPEIEPSASDLIITDLISLPPPNIYGMNPGPDPSKWDENLFDSLFADFDKKIRENSSLCSPKVYQLSLDWLKREGHSAQVDAECAFVELQGYEEDDIIKAEKYFSHCSERIYNLIDYIEYSRLLD